MISALPSISCSSVSGSAQTFRCDSVWLATRCPWAAILRTRSRRAKSSGRLPTMCSPLTKKIAFSPRRSSSSSTTGVPNRSGPSSKVSTSSRAPCVVGATAFSPRSGCRYSGYSGGRSSPAAIGARGPQHRRSRQRRRGLDRGAQPTGGRPAGCRQRPAAARQGQQHQRAGQQSEKTRPQHPLRSIGGCGRVWKAQRASGRNPLRPVARAARAVRAPPGATSGSVARGVADAAVGGRGAAYR